MTWWYNTESGALTSAGSILSFFQQIQGDVGLGAGWHQLKVPSSATEAQAAADAAREFPGGATPTTSVGVALQQTLSQETTGSPESFSDTAHALTGFYDVLTNGKMWRSLGWLLLGLVLMGIGLILWLGPAARRALPAAAVQARRALPGAAAPGGRVRAGPVSAPVLPLVLTGIGTYLAWFGIHYWGSDTRWPTDPVKALLTGRPLPKPAGQQSAAAVQAALSPAAAAGAAAEGPAGTAPAHSGTYDLAALQALWISQGGSPQTAFEAANVAIAESGGSPDATSANPDGGTNVGLWQLDTKGVGAGYTVEQLQDPSVNARITVMHTVNGTTWAQWSDAVVVGGVYTGPSA